MIYLFNSAYRSLYSRNILDTIFLPEGCTNEYRYKVQGDVIHISPEIYSQLKNMKKDEPVAIIFIDRYHEGGYVYHPLRLGNLVACYEADARFYFKIQFKEYIYPIDQDSFHKNIIRSLGQYGIPKLTGNDPDHVDDGNYAIIAGSIFDHNDYYSGDDAWQNIIRNLKDTSVFTDSEEKKHIYLKYQVCTTKQSLINPKLRGDQAVFNLIRGERYELKTTYRFPFQNQDSQKLAKLVVDYSENIHLLGSKEINIDSPSNTVRIPFLVKKNIEFKEARFVFKYGTTLENEEIIAANVPILISIKESTGFWWLIAFLLFLYTGTSVYIGTDFSTVSPLSLKNIFIHLWPKCLASFIQAIVLFFLFRIVGKKFL